MKEWQEYFDERLRLFHGIFGTATVSVQPGGELYGMAIEHANNMIENQKTLFLSELKRGKL